MARKKKHPEHVNHERWLVSYADFITLLFAFFTTMYAISTVDAQKMGKMVMSMKASFDTTVFPAGSDSLTLSKGGGGDALVEQVGAPKESLVRDFSTSNLKDLRSNFLPPTDSARTGKLMGDLKKKIDGLMGLEAFKGRIRTRVDGRGLIISLGEGGLFDSGFDQIRPEGRALLDTLATSLLVLPNHIRVEGHTDNVPIKTSKFPSNWELSTARATAIVVYLIEKFGFTPDRLSAGGYSEFRPVATNDSSDGRARNRRVDIVVMNPRYAMAEPR